MRSGFFAVVSITILDDGSTSPGVAGGSAPGSWHIGKAGSHLKEGMTYGYGGKEKHVPRKSEAGRGRHYVHWVLCKTDYGLKAEGDGKVRIRWVKTNANSVPSNAVKGFNTNENQHVCRHPVGNGLHPGKTVGSAGCHVPYGGKELRYTDFEVLVVDRD